MSRRVLFAAVAASVAVAITLARRRRQARQDDHDDKHTTTAATPATAATDGSSTKQATDSKPYSYTLGYWNHRGIAEPVRYMLAYSGAAWRDFRYQAGPPPHYSKTLWYSAKEGMGMAWPNLPYLQQTCLTDGSTMVLTQTRSILRHLARRYGLACDTSAVAAAAAADQAVEAMFDWWNGLFDVTYCDYPPSAEARCHQPQHGAVHQCVRLTPKFTARRQKYLESTLPAHLQRVQAVLKEHGGPWLIGASLCYADFVLFELLDQHLALSASCLKELPQLQQYHARFAKLPAIAAYRASDRFRAEPLHNRYSHFHTGWVGPEWGSSSGGSEVDIEPESAAVVSKQS